MPFSEIDPVDHPVSLYAATKKANELMAHSYSHLYRLPTTGLRFFTVYGPWGRPDMALFLFTKAIMAEQTIDVYNHGNMTRDFTYVDDIVEGVVKVLARIPTATDNSEKSKSVAAPYKIFNIGNNNPVPLLEFIECLEKTLGRKANKRMLPLQDGDVPETYADTDALAEWIGFVPGTSLSQGMKSFVDWYRSYYDV